MRTIPAIAFALSMCVGVTGLHAQDRDQVPPTADTAGEAEADAQRPPLFKLAYGGTYTRSNRAPASKFRSYLFLLGAEVSRNPGFPAVGLDAPHEDPLDWGLFWEARADFVGMGSERQYSLGTVSGGIGPSLFIHRSSEPTLFLKATAGLRAAMFKAPMVAVRSHLFQTVKDNPAINGSRLRHNAQFVLHGLLAAEVRTLFDVRDEPVTVALRGQSGIPLRSPYAFTEHMVSGEEVRHDTEVGALHRAQVAATFPRQRVELAVGAFLQKAFRTADGRAVERIEGLEFEVAIQLSKAN